MDLFSRSNRLLYRAPDPEAGGGPALPAETTAAPPPGLDAPALHTGGPLTAAYASPAAASPITAPAAAPRPIGLRANLSPWLQYLYFLRFPLLGWLVLPLLCFLDGCTGVCALTRGIITMSRGWQAFYAAFFVATLLMTVLVCARNIVTNGELRFACAPPEPLHRALTSKASSTLWKVLALAHIPTLITLGYVAAITLQEQTGWVYALTDPNTPAAAAALAQASATWPHGGWHWQLWATLLAGLAAAALFWYLVSLFYYWTYPSYEGTEMSALVFPEDLPLFQQARNASKTRFAVWLERVATVTLRTTRAGYAGPGQKDLFELHFLAILALSAFYLLYLFLYPLIAPVLLSGTYLDVLLAVAMFLVFLCGACTVPQSNDPAPPRMDRWGRLFSAIMFALVALFSVFYARDVHANAIFLASSFPTLASLLVILIFFQWFLSGASFLLDRYRVPVLTAVLAVVFLPKLAPSTLWALDQDHYFAVLPTTRIAQIPTPAEAVQQRAPNRDEPYIIVTASGGGIQAAEWTAQVMAQLEKRIREDHLLSQRNYSLHDHLLLTSTVSGGSVGMMPYLLEYTAPSPWQGNLTQRLVAAPACSGLEAVAWGLEYYDLQRLLLTVRFPLLQTAGPGGADAPDRTWALTQALNRNLTGQDCFKLAPDALPAYLSGTQLTLKQATARLQDHGHMPAFTFNTTVAETGGRFLLSNYQVTQDLAQPPPAPGAPALGSDFLPAESFLQAYTQESNCDQGNVLTACYADLSLVTAARLSATFPVVSSATRIPKQYAHTAAHFVDGGYFDNDGTSSVTEFLYAAITRPVQQQGPTPALPGKPLKVLLIEIRDGDDLNPVDNLDDYNHQAGRKTETGVAAPRPWSTTNQLLAPLSGMWNAGHVSVTRRNRRELCTLEKSFTSQLQVYHVVLGIPAQPTPNRPGQFKTAPLSWKLTEGQRQYIERWASAPDKSTQQSITSALEWLKQQMQAGAPPPAPCQVLDQTYMRQ